MTERLSLWALPAIYVGLASAADAGVRLGRDGWRQRRWAKAALGAGLLAAAAPLFGNLLGEGWKAVERQTSTAAFTNHGLDDRAAVRWVLRRRQPGDVLLTTRLALPAVWWYGSVPVGDPNAGRRQRDGAAIFELRHVEGTGCRSDLRDALAGQRRAVIYFGFRFDDVPRGFERLVMDRLSEMGRVSTYRGFGGFGWAAFVDLQAPPEPFPTMPDPIAEPYGLRAAVNGCVAIQPASRW